MLTAVLIARPGLIGRWLGWIAVLGGLLYMTVGVAVGYRGFETPGGPVVQLLFFVFMVGVLVAGFRRNGPGDVAEPAVR